MNTTRRVRTILILLCLLASAMLLLLLSGDALGPSRTPALLGGAGGAALLIKASAARTDRAYLTLTGAAMALGGAVPLLIIAAHL